LQAKYSFDPAFISKLERGVIPPPKSEIVLKRLAKALKIEPRQPEWQDLFDLAAIEGGKNEIHPQLRSNDKLWYLVL